MSQVKVNDTFPVVLEEPGGGQRFIVAEAVVVDIDDNEVTLRIPETQVIMGLTTQLSELEREPEVDRIMLGPEE